MYIHCSVETLVNGTVLDIGPRHVAIQMEVDSIATETVGLTCMGHLNVGYSRHSLYKYKCTNVIFDVGCNLQKLYRF